jgi:hypothetical protein
MTAGRYLKSSPSEGAPRQNVTSLSCGIKARSLRVASAPNLCGGRHFAHETSQCIMKNAPLPTGPSAEGLLARDTDGSGGDGGGTAGTTAGACVVTVMGMRRQSRHSGLSYL